MIWSQKYQDISFEILMHGIHNQPDHMILHSVVPDVNARYSYLSYAPFAQFKVNAEGVYWQNTKLDIKNHEQLWSFLKNKFTYYALPKNLDLPPLLGGAMGYFSYEFSHWLENYPFVPDSFNLPWCLLNFYDQVFAYDHHKKCLYTIATGFPETDFNQREIKALRDLDGMRKYIYSCLETYTVKPDINNIDNKSHHEFTVTSNFSSHEYQSSVEFIKEKILLGEIFQANLTQCFSTQVPLGFSAMELYKALCHSNPAPMSAFLQINEYAWIISSSPERFISLQDDTLLSEPIKGTRRRTGDDTVDISTQKDLECSLKDRAENIMIVDLMRNDLSKVSLADSVYVNELCGVYAFANVFHLISKIQAQIKPGFDAWDVLQATFPPGSITGAPKIQAMKIISSQEKQARGPYCGCLGYWSFTGNMDTSVTIRTFVLNRQKLSWHAGGGIVLDSDPVKEYEESMLKAERLQLTLSQVNLDNIECKS